MEAKRFFKILSEIETKGEYKDGKTHYWKDEKVDKEGEKYILIIADIEHEKYTEQMVYEIRKR